jgi:hypothetical protein
MAPSKSNGVPRILSSEFAEDPYAAYKVMRERGPSLGGPPSLCFVPIFGCGTCV